LKYWQDDPQSYVNLAGESRKTYLHPYLRRVIHEARCETILDYGCGDGALFLEGDVVAKETWLYDNSKRMMDFAKINFADRPGYKFLDDIESAPSDYYDAVILSLVLMTIPSLDEQSFVLRQMARAKKDTGIALVAVTHPCFRQYRFSTFSTEFALGNEFPYLQNGIPFQVMLEDRDSSASVQFTDYHWNLSATINTIVDAGLAIEQIVELPDRPVLDSWHNANFPGYMVIRCS